MVSVSTMLAGLALSAATAQANSLSALPTFDVPAFDYASIAQGENPARLLQALQTDGIIALKNIPNYANLRERYLRTAAECAGVTANADHDMFVSRKLFDDGTKRYTISTNAGRELSGSAMEVDTTCPGYRQLYEEFSQTLEHAVNTFGSTLDQTSFTASDGQRSISSRQLVSDAVRLDHFHAYEAVPSGPASAGVDGIQRQLEELSLPLHEDHGLFIAMSAPKFFDVGADRRLVERELSESASGLVIQTASGSRVRPVLKNDEVVIMMGTGASRWLQTSHSIPAVMHGMKMPEGSENGVRSLRAWFGKMTLLPAYQRMLLSNGVSFEAHSNATTRFLLANQEDDLKTVGCATGRRLMASEGKCTLRECKTKAGKSDPAEGCPVICNRKNHSPDDELNCTASCECTDSSSPAERCWMLCVANLPESECATAEQTCTGQKKTCKSSTSTSTGSNKGSMTGMTGMGSMHMDGSAHKDGSMAMTSGSSAKTDGSSVSTDKTPVPAPSSAVRVLVSSAAVVGSVLLAAFC
ncbi:hypothetical protein Poli38472_013983 [Pythium oligandrum]|uniref:Uncharacterized protein n=1 Tax=Pythium oligandrum TaxID=41045 RepID=A0A8K1CQ54_PYTOL|nr:hypothetical protein Poli38472_013983 [Pythium oligandrum]|eukprot:TMW66671.1 hypothetical protein Poli38472_013983 [Pythium oligandrum]